MLAQTDAEGRVIRLLPGADRAFLVLAFPGGRVTAEIPLDAVADFHKLLLQSAG